MRFERNEKLDARDGEPAQAIIVGDEEVDANQRRAGELNGIRRPDAAVASNLRVSAGGRAIERQKTRLTPTPRAGGGRTDRHAHPPRALVRNPQRDNAAASGTLSMVSPPDARLAQSALERPSRAEMDGQERLPREDLRPLRARGADTRVGWEWLQRPDVLGRRPWMQRLLERVCERQ